MNTSENEKRRFRPIKTIGGDRRFRPIRTLAKCFAFVSAVIASFIILAFLAGVAPTIASWLMGGVFNPIYLAIDGSYSYTASAIISALIWIAFLFGANVLHEMVFINKGQPLKDPHIRRAYITGCAALLMSILLWIVWIIGKYAVECTDCTASLVTAIDYGVYAFQFTPYLLFLLTPRVMTDFMKDYQKRNAGPA